MSTAAQTPKIHEGFPRYERFEPAVPVRCVTAAVPGCLHRFFDTSPISPSGRYLAAFVFPDERRLPEPGEAGRVLLVDLQEGTHAFVAETRGWEPQMGANLNWGGDDHALFFNDVDEQTWDAFAVKLDPMTGKSERMQGTVYHASPDGRWLASANMKTMRRTQGGYGVVVPDACVPRHVGPVEDDGVWLTDTRTGKAKVIVSLAELMRVADSPNLDDPDAFEVYGFHSKFSPCGRRLLFTTRWCRHEPEPAWGLHGGRKDLRYTVFTMDLDTASSDADGFPTVRNLRPTIPDTQWEKHGHHVNWFPDGEVLSSNLRLDRGEMRFVRCDLDGLGLREVLPGVLGSGHPTIHPTANHFLTDSYVHEPPAFEDGTVPLRWINMKDGTEKQVVRVCAKSPEHGVLRVDPHPAWDRTWTHVAFNGYVDGTRRVFVADMRPLLEA